MKKYIALLVLIVLAACNSQKKYSDFDYSFAQSGGQNPVYENFLIKGNNGYYSFEGQGKNIKKDFKLTDDEVRQIEHALTENKFRTIREDYKKRYNQVSTAINVKKGENSASKTDASLIMKTDEQRWNTIVKTFRDLIDAKVQTPAEAQ